jgi:hypothetical protein
VAQHRTKYRSPSRCYRGTSENDELTNGWSFDQVLADRSCHPGAISQRLKYHAVPLGQAQQGGELLL